MKDGNPQTIYLKDYAVPDYLISHVALDFELDAEHTTVVSRLLMARNPASAQTGQALVLEGEGLQLLRVALDGVVLVAGQYRQTEEALIIDDVPQQQPFTLTIENTINPKANTSL